MLSDITLQKHVIDELGWDPALENVEIGVAARDGVVTLNGHVRSYAQRHVAEQAARRCVGVRAVANELEVDLLPSDVRSDTALAHAILSAFQWNVAVPEDALQVEVRDGWVTILGDVAWNFQREAAEATVRTLTGVRGVTNAVTVKPRASAGDIRSNIEAALKRAAEIDAEHIQVVANEGTVTLRGHVRTWAEREDAERVAWAAAGVRRVEDLITIGT